MTACDRRNDLDSTLLMPVLPQALLALVGVDLMPLSLLPTRHLYPLRLGFHCLQRARGDLSKV